MASAEPGVLLVGELAKADDQGFDILLGRVHQCERGGAKSLFAIGSTA